MFLLLWPFLKNKKKGQTDQSLSTAKIHDVFLLRLLPVKVFVTIMQLASRSHIIQLDNVSERKIMIMEKNPVLCLELAFFQYLFKIIPNWLVLCARCELDAHYRNGSLAYLNEGGSCLIRLFFPFFSHFFFPLLF